MKAVVFTLGCKVNRYESDLLLQELENRGYEVCEELVPADIYVLNTCAVTQESEKKSRQAVARCRACNENARIFVVGCASQKNMQSFVKDNVVYIGGTVSKNDILGYLDQEDVFLNKKDFTNLFEDGLLTRPSRTRSFIKIQDGCNNFCSYCIIPYLRGRSRSRKIENIVSEATELSKKVPEIVLTGINTMAFGKDTGETLPDLIRALSKIDARLRLGSFYAEGLTEELLDAFYSLPNFCPHFHLSLQSGDEKVLRDMNRRYTPELYRKKIELLRSFDKNASVTTDLIVGYPTETEENFLSSLDFVRSVGFSDIHVFPFSGREGTKAYLLPKISDEEMRSRKARSLLVKEQLRNIYLERNIGREQEVLWEENLDGYLCGYSKNYIKMYRKEGKEGTVTRVIGSEKFQDGLFVL